MATTVQVGGHPRGFAATSRRDAWWVGPLATALGLLVAFGYLTWAAFQGRYYYAEPYLSPLYSPLLFHSPHAAQAPGVDLFEHAWFGAWPSWWPTFLPASPAFLILIFPGLFRFTCYYYRKAYYRALVWTPPACAVEGWQRPYRGETRLLLFQNLHRYALYCALVFNVILFYDAFVSLRKGGEWGIGVGTIVLFVNAILLACYSLGCHSWRHLIGGRLDCFSCSRWAELRHKGWERASFLNRHHMLFAWTSLFWVAFTDLYVRLVAMGVIADWNTWN